jgi:exodeoxyribonuclease V alpha subunit
MTSDVAIRLTPVGSVRERLGLPNAAPYPKWLVDALHPRCEGRAGSFVYFAWELSRAMKSGSTPEEVEALQILVASTLAGLDEGDTRISLASLPVRFAALGAREGLATRARALLDPDGPAESLVGPPSEEKPLIRDGEYLYLNRIHRRECELSELVRGRLNAKAERSDFKGILDALDAVLAHRPVIGGQPVRLSTEQQQAIRTALTRPLALVSGGFGTGKTSIAVAVLRVLARLGVAMDAVTLAAPGPRSVSRIRKSVQNHLAAIPEPGRADRELIESLRDPRVIDRLDSPGKVVLVFDAEGIDIELMAFLFRSLRPDSKLVLLGDVEQLASVEAGGVFRELLHRSGGAVALKENHGSRDVGDVARAVASGESETIFRSARGAIAVRERASDVRFEGVELLVSDEEAFAERWYESSEPSQRQRVLASTRSDVSSWNERRGRRGPYGPIVGAGDDTPADAETVRDCQGSRFDRVAVVLPEPGHPLLFRHFLTSALTRARQSVTLLGSRESVLYAIERAPERSTGLGERL